MLRIMYIPRPAKLLFTIDDGWNNYLGKHGGSVSQWTRLCVERMLACGTCAMGVRRYCCASPDSTHFRLFFQSCKSKKSTEQWIAEQQHILPDCEWQHITFTMPHLLWPFFNNNWPLLNDLFHCATRAMLKLARTQGIEVGIFCALHTYVCQLNQHPHTHVSVTWVPMLSTASGAAASSLKRRPLSKSGGTPLSACCATATVASCPGLGHIRDERQWRRYMQAQYGRYWKVHFANKTRGAWHSVKYLGRYLKRPQVSTSRLRHYGGGAVVHHYLDHRTGKHKRQTLSQEEMIGRYISHFPARHFKMLRYSGFLANRKRGTLLPKVYEALEMTVREKPKRTGFAVLLKGFVGTDPYRCILCGERLRFAGAVAGDHATKMLSDRLHQMAKKRWLRMPELDRST